MSAKARKKRATQDARERAEILVLLVRAAEGGYFAPFLELPFSRGLEERNAEVERLALALLDAPSSRRRERLPMPGAPR